jgi:hypothetical protein
MSQCSKVSRPRDADRGECFAVAASIVLHRSVLDPMKTEATQTVTQPREAIAYHEAGHAVISMKLGYRCLYVTIIPDGDRLGHVCCEDPMAGGHDDKIKHALKVLIAASLAESKHIGSRTWGDADDRLKATNLALLATERNVERAEALINDMIGEARKLVERHWADIEKLAEQLLVERRVNLLAPKATGSEASDSR